MQNVIARFVKDESGATAIEYGLLAALIGVGIVGGASVLRDNLGNTLNSVGGVMGTANSEINGAG